MGKIYEHSSRTLIWLSIDDKRVVAETIDFLKEQAGYAIALVEKYGLTADIPDVIGGDKSYQSRSTEVGIVVEISRGRVAYKSVGNAGGGHSEECYYSLGTCCC
jgi:hypothetical protein